MLSTIRDLIEKGNFTDALHQIELTITSDVETFIECKILKCIILREQGKYEEAISVISKAIEKSKLNKNKFYHYKSLAELSYILYRQDKFDDTVRIIEEADYLAIRLEDQFDKLLDARFTLLNVRGNIFWKKSRIDQALNYYTKSLEVAKKTGNKSHLAQVYNSLGIVSIQKGELTESLNYHEKSLEIAIIDNNIKYQIYNYNNIAEIYRNTGLFDSALQYYKKAEAANKDSIISSIVPTINGNFGLTYFKKREFTKAIHYLDLAYSQHLNLNAITNITEILFYKLLINIEMGRVDRAEENLLELKKYDIDQTNKTIAIRTKIAKAVHLRSNNIKELKLKSIGLLEEIVAQDFFYSEYNIIAIIYLCDSYLDIFQLNQEELYLNQAEQLIDKLIAISEELKSKMFKIEALILKSKLSIVKSEINRIDDLLMKAREYSEEIDLGYITSNLNIDHAKLIENIIDKHKFSSREKILDQRNKLMRIANTVSDFVNHNLDEDELDIFDTPIAFYILNKNGSTIFAYNFPQSDEYNLSTFQKIISMISQLSQINNKEYELFDYDDIKFRFIYHSESVLCCVYRGNSSALYQKMINIIIQLKNLIPSISFENIFQDLDKLSFNKALINGFVRELFLKIFPMSMIVDFNGQESLSINKEKIENGYLNYNIFPHNSLILLNLFNNINSLSYEEISRLIDIDTNLIDETIDQLINLGFLHAKENYLQLSNKGADHMKYLLNLQFLDNIE